VESSGYIWLATKAIFRQSVQAGVRHKITILPQALITALTPQGREVCSSCLSELGAVCARLVSKLPTIPNDLMLFGRSFRSC
jgi:hypothetical protein